MARVLVAENPNVQCGPGVRSTAESTRTPSSSTETVDGRWRRGVTGRCQWLWCRPCRRPAMADRESAAQLTG